MNTDVLRDITYGMYVLTTRDIKSNKNVGCFINTLVQITSSNPIVSVSVNKNNYTNKILKETMKCAISILSCNTSINVISKFGFFSSLDVDKFDGINYEEVDDLPVVSENICGYLIGNVINVIDCFSHDIFLIEVKRCEKKNNLEPMTYKYYHENLKGISPKNAPTYIEENTSTDSNRYRCSICGYIYDDSKEKVKFDDLSDDWKCPLCGVGKEFFVKIS